MTEMILLSDAQMARISPFFPLSHGIPRVDDRRVISGIIFVIRNGLRWRDVPPSYGPHKTIYNRFIRWSELGVFGRIFLELARKQAAARPDSEASKLNALTSRERQTVDALMDNPAAPAKVLAKDMAISEHTLRNHLTSIYSKLGVGNRTELYAFVQRHRQDNGKH